MYNKNPSYANTEQLTCIPPAALVLRSIWSRCFGGEQVWREASEGGSWPAASVMMGTALCWSWAHTSSCSMSSRAAVWDGHGWRHGQEPPPPPSSQGHQGRGPPGHLPPKHPQESEEQQISLCKGNPQTPHRRDLGTSQRMQLAAQHWAVWQGRESHGNGDGALQGSELRIRTWHGAASIICRTSQGGLLPASFPWLCLLQSLHAVLRS